MAGLLDRFNEYSDNFNLLKNGLLGLPVANIPKAELQEKPSLWNLIARELQQEGGFQGDVSYGDAINAVAEVLPLTETVMDVKNFGDAAIDGNKLGMALEGANIALPKGLEGLAAAGILAGRKAKTLNPKTLELAEKMKAQGASRDEIWKATGEQFDQPAYFDAVDDSFRFEIDDSESRLMSEGLRDFHNETSLVRQGRMMDHENLSNAYPDADMITYRKGDNNGASYSSNLDEIRMPPDSGHPDMFNELRETSVKSPALHELQHAIQKREGFARGGMPEMFEKTDRDIANGKWARIVSDSVTEGSTIETVIKELKDEAMGNAYGNDSLSSHDLQSIIDLINSDNPSQLLVKWKNVDTAPSNSFSQYRSLLGEADARAVQTRLDMPMQERINNPFWNSYDVPEDELIRRYDGGEPVFTTGYKKG